MYSRFLVKSINQKPVQLCKSNFFSKPIQHSFFNKNNGFKIRYFSSNTSYTPLLYTVLGLNKNFSSADLKRAYYQHSLKNHPDNPTGSAIKFLEIKKAYTILNQEETRKKYDSMSPTQHGQFEIVWKIEYHPNKEKMENLDKFATRQNIKKNSFLGFVLNKIKSHYNSMIIYEERKASSDSANNCMTNRHIYFVLDSSDSMFTFNRHDPYLKNVPFKMTSSRFNKGIIEGVTYPVEYDAYVKYTLKINKCLRNITSIITDLIITKNTYLCSLITFSGQQTTIATFQSLIAVKSTMTSTPDWKFRSLMGDKTHIYDSIKYAIQSVEQKGNLGLTTFVLFTDGGDSTSELSLNDIVDYIKEKNCVNLIILTFDLKSQENANLKKIVSAAKFGKLLEINNFKNDYSFSSIDAAFSKTKEIILADGYTDSFDPKQTFGL